MTFQEQPAIDLTELAKTAMRERDLLTEFSSDVQKAADQAPEAISFPPSTKDARQLLWCSIDNDDSRDLDQLTYAESLDEGRFRIFIAIADVDERVPKNSVVDRHAQYNTVSVYTPTKVFSMLPERFSTDLTSLNEGQDRLAIVVEVEVNADGSLGAHTLYQALVYNHAKLAYNSVAAWLDGTEPMPNKIGEVAGMEAQLRLQDQITTLLKQYRHYHGALTLETLEPQAVVQNHRIVDIKIAKKNRARDLIEDFMIAANTSTAIFLKNRELPSFRRIVRVPKRWDRIVEIAKELGEKLPDEPDSKALDLFLIKRRSLDPLHFPDLSLTIIKLLGNGEYIVEYPNDMPIGHFGLALRDYTHSTAPNRRYPDLITQRILKSALENKSLPYPSKELEKLAKHCTTKEDEAEKVERKMRKSAAILLLYSKFGEVFDAIVTGASVKGTWVRILHPPVEGKLVKGYEHKDVGDQIRVKLTNLDIENGFIDFVRVH